MSRGGKKVRNNEIYEWDRQKNICREYATPLKDLKMGERTFSDNTAGERGRG